MFFLFKGLLIFCSMSIFAGCMLSFCKRPTFYAEKHHKKMLEIPQEIAAAKPPPNSHWHPPTSTEDLQVSHLRMRDLVTYRVKAVASGLLECQRATLYQRNMLGSAMAEDQENVWSKEIEHYLTFDSMVPEFLVLLLHLQILRPKFRNFWLSPAHGDTLGARRMPSFLPVANHGGRWICQKRFAIPVNVLGPCGAWNHGKTSEG